MNLSAILLILVLLIIYALLISILVAVINIFNAAQKVVILLAFVVFGALSGVAVAWVWPYDSSIYPNFVAVIAADAIYDWATRTMAPGSADAHDNIPWLLRIPQSYIWVSTVLSGLVGLILQLLLNLRRPRHRDQKPG